MRRIRRLVPFGTVAEKLFDNQKNERCGSALLRSLPAKLFGATIAAQITEVEMKGHILFLRVPDATWRKELEVQHDQLLAKARRLHRQLNKVVLTP